MMIRGDVALKGDSQGHQQAKDSTGVQRKEKKKKKNKRKEWKEDGKMGSTDTAERERKTWHLR